MTQPAEPIRVAVERLAASQGYTELRYNPETMNWTYHRPDQGVGADGRVYVRAGPRPR